MVKAWDFDSHIAGSSPATSANILYKKERLKMKFMKNKVYSLIPTVVIQDKRLSLEALGLFSSLCIQTEDTEDISFKDFKHGILQIEGNSPEIFDSALNELLTYGYLEYDQNNDDYILHFESDSNSGEER